LMIVTALEAKSEPGHADKKNSDHSFLLPSCWTL
jgi:hypothetical protein